MSAERPVLYMPIGLPASGKSTFLSRLEGVEIIGGDRLRGELFGNENIQYTEEFLKENGIDAEGMTQREKENAASRLIWDICRRKALQLLREGRSVAYDGVNNTKHIRSLIMRHALHIASVHAAYFTADAETCIARDLRRERTAGEAAIRRFAEHMSAPSFDEGFDVIDTYDENGVLISHRTKEEE